MNVAESEATTTCTAPTEDVSTVFVRIGQLMDHERAEDVLEVYNYNRKFEWYLTKLNSRTAT
eukprot:2985707-Pleurochrysis_carterae.AAC.1